VLCLRRFSAIPPSLLAAVAGFAADFSAQTVDGLNRPISDVQIDVDCLCSTQKPYRYISSPVRTGWLMLHTMLRCANPDGSGSQRKATSLFFGISFPICSEPQA